MRPLARRRWTVLFAAACLGAAAPFQCTGEPDPALAVEESPGEALYRLAESFHDAGKRDAWLETLRYIVERFPNSRFAVVAADDLARDAADAGPAPIEPR